MKVADEYFPNIMPKRIIVRGVNWLGDAVMTTPALQLLRSTFPEAHIVLFTHEKLAQLWQNHPAINSVRTFADNENVWSLAHKMRREKADTALVFPNSPRSAIECWLAGIPQRVGYKRRWRNFFLTHGVNPRREDMPMRKRSEHEIKKLVRGGKLKTSDPGLKPKSSDAHHIFNYLHLVSALGVNPGLVAPKLFVTQDEIDAALKRFGIEQGPRTPLFGLFPGAEYGPAKRWPLNRFIETAIRIQASTGCRWLVFGGRNDVEPAAQIIGELSYEARRLPVSEKIPREPTGFNLAGQTSLRELMALLKVCRVLLSNDSGPMHVAAALGTPVVVPFGSTSAELTGPGLPGDIKNELLVSDAPCSPCFLRECPIDFRCMNGISVDDVVDATVSAAQRNKPTVWQKR